MGLWKPEATNDIENSPTWMSVAELRPITVEDEETFIRLMSASFDREKMQQRSKGKIYYSFI